MTYFLQLSLTGLLIGGLYAMVAASVVLIYKSTRVVSIAHGQFLAFGALFLWMCLTVLGLPLWLAFPLVLVFAIFLGFVVERLAMRPLIGQPQFAAFLMTFSLFLVLDGIFQLIIKGQSKGLPPFLPKGVLSIGGVSLPISNLSSFGVAIFIFLMLALFFRYTKVGLGMRATSEDHQLAQSTGITVRTIFSLIWIISTIVAAIAGIAIANVMDIHFPLPYIVIKGLIVALFGGLESLTGAFIGGIFLGVIENVSAGYLDPIVGGGVQEVAAYVLLLVILLVKPYGLFGLVRIERI
jgi:branched-chain amino acid transport system permease protein